eukprot:8628651-Pyramimonas_sp.AAC.1
MPFYHFVELLEAQSDSAVGPDGLPYSVWWKGGRLMHETLCELYEALLSGTPLPHQFSVALSVFLPKGTEREGQCVIARQPAITRPIALSSTDRQHNYQQHGWL